MVPKTHFIDSSFFVALILESDLFHDRALKIWHRILEEQSPCVTSNYILDESFTIIRNRLGVKVVKNFNHFFSTYGSQLQVMRVTSQDETQAWQWFVLDWSKLSFTDCVSFAQMKRLDIGSVATFDLHFERAGFKVL